MVAQVVRHAAAGAHHVVDADAEPGVEPVEPAPPQRVDERHRVGQVRADPVEGQRALLERLEDQREVELLQVAQPAVEQLRGAAGGAGGEVAGLDQAHPQAAGDGVERGARAGDAGPDDQHVELLGGQPLAGPRRGWRG